MRDGLQQTPNVPDWSILYIILVLAAGLAIGWIGIAVEAFVQEALVAAWTVISDQVVP
ncbi:phage holin family protein [Paenibacillus solani]|nr:phage holin family protein [Paenibacillus solani]